MTTDAPNRLAFEVWQDPFPHLSFTHFREDLGEVTSSRKLPLDVFALIVPEARGEGFEGGPALAGEDYLAFFELWSAQLRAAALEN